jgi:hypothetical protein
MNSTTTYFFFNTHFNIILYLFLCLPCVLRPPDFQTKTLYAFLFSPKIIHSNLLKTLDFITVGIYDRYKIHEAPNYAVFSSFPSVSFSWVQIFLITMF